MRKRCFRKTNLTLVGQFLRRTEKGWRSGKRAADQMSGCWRGINSGALRRWKSYAANNSLSFFHVIKLIGLEILESVDLAARPADFEKFDFIRGADAKMHA